ncbi:MAG: MaoC/PaaZ C-terminal domain-containing protein [Anaerovoracaceae bacterium]
MAMDLTCIGKKHDPVVTPYTWRDVALYALGIGSGKDELQYVYEKNMKVFPTWGFQPASDVRLMNADLEPKGAHQEGMLSMENDLTIYRPIPLEGEFHTTAWISHIYDRGKEHGALIVDEMDTTDANGELLFHNKHIMYAGMDGGFGGEQPPYNKVEYPDRDPDFVFDDFIGESQNYIYRLNGDYEKVHCDPDVAKAVGLKGPIMHGLCTTGFAARACVNSLFGDRPEAMKHIRAAYKKPVYPGTKIQTQIWKDRPGHAVFKTFDAAGNLLLGNCEIDWEE